MDQLEHLKRESNTAKQGEMRARRREQVLQEREHKAKAGSAGLLRKESSAATQAVKQLLQERGNKRKTRKTGSAGSLEQEQQHKQFATQAETRGGQLMQARVPRGFTQGQTFDILVLDNCVVHRAL